MFWSAVTKEGKNLMEERNVLSPHRDRASLMSVVELEVATSSWAGVTEDGGEEDSGLEISDC